MIRFGEFEADIQAGELRKAGRRIKIQHQPFQLLSVLLEQPGELVSREELQRRLWPAGTIVEFEHSLNTALKKIRQALEDSASNPRFVETVPRRGYRFIAPVSKGHGSASAVPAAASGRRTPVRRQVVLPIGMVVAIALVVGAYWLLRPGVNTSEEPLTVQLTSYPTLERHPSLSPDGNQVAFSWNGQEGNNFDIYVKQVEGQIALRLTMDPAPDAHPAWSPDGRWIAFERAGVGLLLISPLGGPERKIARAGSAPSWTPDSQSLVCIEGGLPQRPHPQAVFQISITTAEKEQLTFPPSGYWGDDNPAVSPDFQTLAFTRTRQPGVSELFLQPFAGGEASPVIQEAARMAGLAWTADSKEIVFASDRRGAWRLWRVAPGGRTTQPRPIVGAGDAASWPTLSREDSGPAFLLAYERSFAAAGIHLTALNDTSGAGTLKGKPLIESTRQDWHPRFSPGGTRIAFTSDRSGTPQVWTCNGDGSRCIQLTSFEVAAFGPQWSSDSRFIAFSGISSTATRVANVFVMDLQGGQLHQLTHYRDSDALMRSWSRNAHSVYFHSSRAGEQRIWKMAVAGGEAVPVTKREAVEGQESADGSWFYFIGPQIATTPGLFGQPGPLWRVPVGGGPEEPVLDGASFSRWEVTPMGVYFIELSAPRDASDQVKFFSFKTCRVSSMGSLQEKVARSRTGFSVSPDGRSFLTVHDKAKASDLMLLKTFR